ncbi:hypothetical protein C8J57DRAFT_1304176 [Mycena rebaudengoi]|nr:hypothetical protein C8J57DRAFT_1304176 [Mycena rebaudengoi]
MSPPSACRIHLRFCAFLPARVALVQFSRALYRNPYHRRSISTISTVSIQFRDHLHSLLTGYRPLRALLHISVLPYALKLGVWAITSHDSTSPIFLLEFQRHRRRRFRGL